MGKLAAAVFVFACASACAKGGGDSSVVDCTRLNMRISDCVMQLAMSQATIAGTGRSASEALAGAFSGRIGTECPQRQGRLEDAKAVNECLSKSKCEEMAACFDKLAP